MLTGPVFNPFYNICMQGDTYTPF